MRREPTTSNMTAKALTNARPVAVSLVNAGANQRPFKVVKSAEVPDKPLPHTIKQEDKTMNQQGTLKQKAGFDIASVAFAIDKFPNEEAARKWLDDGGYVDYDIESSSKGFSVVSAVDFEEGSFEAVEVPDEGVTVMVGKLVAEPESTAAEKAAAEATDQASKVADTSESAEKSDDDKRLSVMKSMLEGVVGDEDKVDADGIVSRAKSMYETHEIADVVMDLSWLVRDADWMGVDEASVAKLKTAALIILEVLTQVMGDTVDDFAKTFRQANTVEKTGAQASETAAAAGDQAVEAAAEDATSVTKGGEPDKVAAKDATPDPADNADISALTAAVTSLAATVQKGFENVDEKIAKSEKSFEARVEGLEAVSQTRKGAGETTEAKVTKTDAEVAEENAQKAFSKERLRSNIGM